MHLDVNKPVLSWDDCCTCITAGAGWLTITPRGSEPERITPDALAGLGGHITRIRSLVAARNNFTYGIRSRRRELTLSFDGQALTLGRTDSEARRAPIPAMLLDDLELWLQGAGAETPGGPHDDLGGFHAVREGQFLRCTLRSRISQQPPHTFLVGDAGELQQFFLCAVDGNRLALDAGEYDGRPTAPGGHGIELKRIDHVRYTLRAYGERNKCMELHSVSRPSLVWLARCLATVNG